MTALENYHGQLTFLLAYFNISITKLDFNSKGEYFPFQRVYVTAD